jgi:hypothetical protein
MEMSKPGKLFLHVNEELLCISVLKCADHILDLDVLTIIEYGLDLIFVALAA